MKIRQDCITAIHTAASLIYHTYSFRIITSIIFITGAGVQVCRKVEA